MLKPVIKLAQGRASLSAAEWQFPAALTSCPDEQHARMPVEGVRQRVFQPSLTAETLHTPTMRWHGALRDVIGNGNDDV